MALRFPARTLMLLVVALQLVLQPLAALAPCALAIGSDGCCCSTEEAPAADEDLGGCCAALAEDEAEPSSGRSAETPPEPCDCRLAPSDVPVGTARTTVDDVRLIARASSSVSFRPAIGAPARPIASVVRPGPVPRGPTRLHVLHQRFLL